MAKFLITVKLLKNPAHNPRKKITGPCPVAKDKLCTDVTGEHHTILFESTCQTIEGALEEWPLSTVYHVTRVEQV